MLASPLLIQWTAPTRRHIGAKMHLMLQSYLSPLMCRFLGRPARRMRLGTGLQASEKRQGTKSRGAFRVYGDLTGAAMMAGLA